MFETFDEILEMSDYVALDDLIRKGFDPSKPDKYGIYVLNPVCKALNVELAKQLIQTGADVNALSEDGFTPLISAIENSHLNPIAAVELVSLLLDAGADIEQRGDWDKTPFLKSCTRGIFSVTQLLVDRGCDVYAKSKELGGAMGAREFADMRSNSLEFKRYIEGLVTKEPKKGAQLKKGT